MADTAIPTQSPNRRVALNGLMELTAAFQIIEKVRKTNLKWQSETLNTILYDGTELYRPIPRDGFVGENEILEKNVYFLATQTENLCETAVHALVNANVLTIDEEKLILQQPTNKLRAAQFYALLVEKEDPDGSIANSVVSVLNTHGNTAVMKLFAERFNLVPIENFIPRHIDTAGGQQEQEQQDRSQEIQEVIEVAQGENVEQLTDGRWACNYCTFINPVTSNICEVCSKTSNFNPDDSLDVNICPQCTLMNENGALTCQACEFVFERSCPQCTLVIENGAGVCQACEYAFEDQTDQRQANDGSANESVDSYEDD